MMLTVPLPEFAEYTLVELRLGCDEDRVLADRYRRDHAEAAGTHHADSRSKRSSRRRNSDRSARAATETGSEPTGTVARVGIGGFTPRETFGGVEHRDGIAAGVGHIEAVEEGVEINRRSAQLPAATDPPMVLVAVLMMSSASRRAVHCPGQPRRHKRHRSWLPW